MSETFEMVAKTLYGLEDVLADELSALGAKDLQIGRRMVAFTGDKELLYKANFCCRTALRILMPIYHFKANDADKVYEEAKKVEWEKYLSLEKTFAIDSVIYSEDFNHSKFVAYRTKDAIVDYFYEKVGKRPSVRVNNPDIYINIHISHNDCTLSIDSSGESLHKRGYRASQTEAPLSEVLAAGMILKTGWKGESNFVDPMCGSGTLLIEAAMIALNIAPGIYRKEFAFQKWMDYDAELFDKIYNDDSQDRPFAYKCYGSDISPAAIAIAEENVRNAGLVKYIDLAVKPFQQITEAPKPGILVTNPPYGERLSSNDLLGLYSIIGERLKHVFMGYKAWIISYKDECFDKIGLRASEKIKLMNGSLECEYRCYEMFEGSNKDYKKALYESGERPPMRDDSPREDRRSDSGDRERRFKRDDRGERRFDRDRERRFGDRDRREDDRDRRFGRGDRDRKFSDRGDRRRFEDRDDWKKGGRDKGDRPRGRYRDGNDDRRDRFKFDVRPISKKPYNRKKRDRYEDDDD